jgi:hypothetical protein
VWLNVRRLVEAAQTVRFQSVSSTTLPSSPPRATISHLGDAFERKASPDGALKASLFQPLAELGNAGRAFSLVHVVGSCRRCWLDGRRSDAAHL